VIARKEFSRGLTAAAVLAAAFSFCAGTRAQAMPIFAKAYGLQCSACHTMVPGLNAYGRFVQRTGYASLDRDVLKEHLPFWLGEQINGDNTGGVSDRSPTHTIAAGNVALHGAGYLAPDFTYHVQQWLIQNDKTGGSLDTAWVTYNNLFHRDGHLFVGKIESPGPSPYSQWFDVSGFAAAGVTVGEHTWQADANRWGAKLGYVHDNWNAEVAWLGSGNGLPGAADFDTVPGTDKTFAWKLVQALPDHPYEFGIFGSSGSFIVSSGDPDHYSSMAGYVQRDPTNGFPGVLAIYQIGNDSNPGFDADGNQFPSARSRAFSAELYEPLFGDNALLGLRTETTNDGLGTTTNFANVNLAFNVPGVQYLHGYIEAGMLGNSSAPSGGPDWRWFLWWTTPLGK
jgi:hypothetical protein